MLAICGFLSAGLYCYWLNQSTEYAQATLFDLWLVGFAGALISFGCWYYFHQSYKNTNVDLFNKEHLFCVLLFALLFRLIGFFVFPILEDDFYRFLWDGRLLVEEGSPYGIPPSSFFADANLSDKFSDILGSINHPDVSTIYGPVLQWLFAVAYLVAPGELWPLKVIILFADIGVIALLLFILKLRNAPFYHIILYAWSPLIIKEFIVSVHPDVIGVLLLLLGIILSFRGLAYWSAVVLALAVSAKIFAFIVVPLLLGFAVKRWLVFIAVCVLVSIPLGVKAAWVPDGLVVMATHWFFNAPLYSLLTLDIFMPLLSFNEIKVLLLSIFSCIWFYFFFIKSLNENSLTIRGDYLFLFFFLCLPAFNAWYLVWLLPFAVIWPTRWAWVASFSIFLSYASGINLAVANIDLYEQLPLFFVLQYLLIVLSMVLDIFRDKKKLL